MSSYFHKIFFTSVNRNYSGKQISQTWSGNKHHIPKICSLCVALTTPWRKTFSSRFSSGMGTVTHGLLDLLTTSHFVIPQVKFLFLLEVCTIYLGQNNCWFLCRIKLVLVIFSGHSSWSYVTMKTLCQNRFLLGPAEII